MKPMSEKDRLYFEMKALYTRIGKVLREYEASLPPVGEVDKKRLVVLDPWTGKPFTGFKKRKEVKK